MWSRRCCPTCYILCLGFGLLIVTLVSGVLQAIGQESIEFLGREWSLSGVSGVLLYLLGLVGEIFVLTLGLMVMPVGRLSWRHALLGGATAALLWEVTRHVLVWYFSTLSQVNVVYGSLTTAIVVLFSLEIAATLLLLGAQVISEYERIGLPDKAHPANPLHTEEPVQASPTRPSQRLRGAGRRRRKAQSGVFWMACRPLVSACSRTSAPARPQRLRPSPAESVFPPAGWAVERAEVRQVDRLLRVQSPVQNAVQRLGGEVDDQRAAGAAGAHHQLAGGLVEHQRRVPSTSAAACRAARGWRRACLARRPARS